jgi:SAM-dependent methyltransferase
MGAGNGLGRSSPLCLVGQRTEATFYARYLSRACPTVLVLGCGAGRIPWELSDQGAEAVGVDPSTSLIAAAEERRATEAAHKADRVRFLSADLRSLRLGRRFALVVAPNNAFGLMSASTDLEALLATARQHLAADGVLVFDVVNATRAFDHPRLHPESGLSLFQRPAIRGVFAPHLRDRRRSGLNRSASIRRLHLRQLNLEHVESAIRDAGFASTEKYGRYDGKPFEPADPIQIVVAQLA